ncbi:MAG: hypothetical protein ABJF11_12890 [Reichenbachiella sp.]|uniref:cytidylyltransferase domain-containing protein n=1 Tax=Reichenbachiella sp. TaxID=2184521 RepID=UPI0032650D1A
MKTSYGFVIQARMGSSRFPGKMLTEIVPGQTLIELIIDKLRRVDKKLPIILATTVNKLDDVLVDIAKKMEVDVYRGSEHNVLQRFAMAMDSKKLTHAIRVCADNPFLDVDLLKDLFHHGKSDPVDYLGYKLQGDLPAIKSHYGFFAEFVSREGLEKIMHDTNEVIYLEHVTNYFYEYPERFRVKWLNTPLFIDQDRGIRLTFDSEIDLINIQEVLQNFTTPLKATAAEICQLVNQSPELSSRMKIEIERNKK